ncbi:MAG: hypothetical protein KDD50_15660 [Bdellovibrionales bacterium]|nr:hypothetical protein [Bdellovibrionales bacterium]
MKSMPILIYLFICFLSASCQNGSNTNASDSSPKSPFNSKKECKLNWNESDLLAFDQKIHENWDILGKKNFNNTENEKSRSLSNLSLAASYALPEGVKVTDLGDDFVNLTLSYYDSELYQIKTLSINTLRKINTCQF